MNSLPESSAVQQPRMDQFVTVWPLRDKSLATGLNRIMHRSEASSFCDRAINAYDVMYARKVIADVRAVKNTALDGRGPYLFGWIPADDFGKSPELILMLDLSRVTTYEQALVQLQSWQQKIATNEELLRRGLSVELARRIVRDWADQHGQAFLILIGAV
ncbi:hypothetical protein [Roseivivax sp. THAF30]|uniref:hypothetical protein n=1 Tax=Roseivivax sp. THAF30 TaxID=2587852 RepID=UPI0012A87D0A|nr:hypothetical protein [Roseivivax sp. THAF30]QFT61570.1 hypothetical protein FIU91_01410 [Roseivivax sp. THAF30]